MGIAFDHVIDYPSRGRAWCARVRIAGGHESTVHVATHPLARTRLRVARIDPPRPVAEWCREARIDEALNGGFLVKPQFEPLGELRIDGAPHLCHRFPDPWHDVRGAIRIDDEGIMIGALGELQESSEGDLLHAGPVLVREGRVVVAESDPEGLSTTSHQFDNDITDRPHPRTAIAVTEHDILAISVDGRQPGDDGLLLHELAAVLVELGAVAALNLDGGSMSVLVTAGEMRNRPRNHHGNLLDGGFPTATALAFEPRGT